jgi:hypothetical protein
MGVFILDGLKKIIKFDKSKNTFCQKEKSMKFLKKKIKYMEIDY